MKSLPLILCVFLLFSSCSKRKNSKQNIYTSIHFKWHSGKIGGKKYKHAAMMIPVSIDTLDFHYKMQLDFGAPGNIFYGGIINNIIQHYPYLKSKVSKVDSANYTLFKAPIFMGYGNSGVKIKPGHYYPNVGKKSLKNSKSKKYIKGKMGTIGLIGVSQFKDKVLKIDFENQKINILDSLNRKVISECTFTNFMLVGNNRLIVELKIGNKPVKVMYDTGASFISIYTFNKKKFNYISNTPFSSLGQLSTQGFDDEVHKIYIGKLGKNIYLNGTKLNEKNAKAYYGKSLDILQILSENSGVYYLIGNQFFIGQTIIIDFKNHKFGICK